MGTPGWLAISGAGFVLLTYGCGAVEQTWDSTPDPSVGKATPVADSPAAASQATNQVQLSARTSLPQPLPTGTTTLHGR